MNYIPRKIASAIDDAKPFYNVIVITGPRQAGKTTLARQHFDDYKYHNLEDVAFREAVSADPKAFLANAPEKLIIDEVQHLPALLSYIQLEVDFNPDRKFVLTGSSNFALLESITQSLAGRAALFTLLPFALSELPVYASQNPTDNILVNGLYPGVVVRNTPPGLFFSNYYSTYVERDVRQIRAIDNLPNFQAFMRLLAGRVGSELNASSLATEIGVSAPTIKSWINVLQASYIAFPLRPFYANISKRLVKSPKIYFYDTGLLCFLLGVNVPGQLSVHPLRGGVFENLVVAELIKNRFNSNLPVNIYYYRENKGREVDILQDVAGQFNLFEIKSSMTFRKDFMANMDYLSKLFPEKVVSKTIIYDGQTIPSIADNFRNI